MTYDDWKLMTPEDERERFYAYCMFCDAHEPGTILRVYDTSPWGRVESWICEACFTPTDTGPCWDDLEEV